MWGFLIGTICLVGLVKVARGNRCGPGGYGYGRWGGRGGHGSHGGRHGYLRGMLRYVFERLETSPGQEKVISAEVDTVLEAVRGVKSELHDYRGDLAASLRGETFDHEALNRLFTRQDGALVKMKEAVKSGMAKIHEALDERQRRDLAAIIEGSGYGRWA